ncbi:MAG: DUF2589 domain-containing protein [Verrucomicrobia bacterium]|nr:DUF2589 domain-containing protein [Verrucomicrobiota bacterium]
MTAVIKAQALAAQTTVDFIEKIGLQEDPNTGELSLRTAEFSFIQPLPDPANPGAVIEQEATLRVPLLSMAPIPFIRVSDLNVSFEFKIRDVSSNQSKFEITGKTGFESTTTAKGKTGFGGGVIGFLGGASASGSVEQKTNVTASVSATYQSSNRQMTDRSATFKMTMNAVQDALPEGLARLLTILNDTINSKKAAP